MNVVGLDLSLTATGIATEAGTEVLATKLKACARLAWLRDAVRARCTTSLGLVATADLVVIEGYSFASRNSRAHAAGELGGVIRLALHEAGVPFVEVPPSTLKKYATGHGNAGKGEVLAAAIRRLGYEGHDDNEADALWLRQMGIDHYGLTLPSAPMPESHRVALDKVDWPELEVAA